MPLKRFPKFLNFFGGSIEIVVTTFTSHRSLWMGATVVEFTGNQTFDQLDKFAARFINFFAKVVKFRLSQGVLRGFYLHLANVGST